MKLLIVTQVVDSTDPFLGFFHGWLKELSTRFERIEVICLKEGQHSLPANVRVHSLGKEGGASRGKYIVRFLRYVWQLRREYDTVFVHMNQEYILLAGWLWSILGKRIYLWRNHYAGGLLTDVAATFATKVFCTSKYSYTAKYKKTIIMPVGVDTGIFKPQTDIVRAPRSILFFSRFAPSKRPDVLLEALRILRNEGIPFEASFYGGALPHHASYREDVMRSAKEHGLTEIAFHEGVPHTEAPNIFSAHEIFANLSSSGMYDKTIFEAAACGCFVLASSRDFAALVGEQFLLTDAEDAKTVAEKLRETLSLSEPERAALASKLQQSVLRGQGLKTLGERIAEELNPE